MNTKNKIVAILMAGIVAMAIGIPAMVSADDVDIDATVGNAAPSVCCKWEEPDSTPTDPDNITVMPNQNANKTVTIVACVCDPNGNGDITGVSANVTGPTGFTPVTVTLTADGTVNCAGCTCSPAPSVSCTGYSGTFDMAPCDPAGTYTVGVTATDGELTSDPLVNTFEYLSMMGIDLDLTAVGFGSVAPGGSKEVAGDDTFGGTLLTVKSTNNAAIDVQAEVKTTMTDGSTNTISDANIGCRVDAKPAATTYSSLGSAQPYDVNLGCGATENVDLKLTVDPGQPAGSYSGALTFTAIAA